MFFVHTFFDVVFHCSTRITTNISLQRHQVRAKNGLGQSQKYIPSLWHQQKRLLGITSWYSYSSVSSPDLSSHITITANLRTARFCQASSQATRNSPTSSPSLPRPAKFLSTTSTMGKPSPSSATPATPPNSYSHTTSSPLSHATDWRRRCNAVPD